MDYGSFEQLVNRSMLARTISTFTASMTTLSTPAIHHPPTISVPDGIQEIDDDLGNIIVAGTNRPSIDRYADIRENMLIWAMVDGFIFVVILCGNCLTIAAVQFSRRLRSVISNLFVLSLAISDLLVGLTIPYHLAFYFEPFLGESHYLCIMKFFLNIVACCVSIWNLIAIAVDRYIAIVYPLHYSRWITKRVAITVIIIGWILGTAMGAIPLFWNNWDTSNECEFDEVLPPWYLAGIITPIFSLIWLCMLTLYWRIWREAYKHAKQLRASITGLHDGGHSDWKSVQVVILILGCFTVCWMPYFIVACSQIFNFNSNNSLRYYKAAFSLAMANSGMNPLIYAWKNRNFRRAFSHLLHCKAPDSHALIDDDNARQNTKRKSSSLPPSMSVPPPTPNSIISATPPPDLHRYSHGLPTAFPLPPPPPSPQSPLQRSMEAIPQISPRPPLPVGISTESYVVDIHRKTGAEWINSVQSANQMDIESISSTQPPSINISTGDHHSKCDIINLYNNNNNQHYTEIHIDKPNNINHKDQMNNNNTELFIQQLTSQSPSNTIVSAPITPTGNLIVNILGNLENHYTNDITKFRNSTNCIIITAPENGSTMSMESNKTTVLNRVPQHTVASKTTSNGTIECVLAINNNADLMLSSELSPISANSMYCNRSYNKSLSAPHCINRWSE